MDQLKDALRLAIKYRFWIAVGLSALLPIIAYVVGSGPIKAKAEATTKTIKDAKKDSDQFTAPGLPNKQWKPLVDDNTTVLAKDVYVSHSKLYNRQAPLLTWPESVQERFQTWGRAWPETVDASQVQITIVDYVNSYPKFVTEVYTSFHPYDYETGKGIVAAPPEEQLLRPAKYDETNPPDLGKVWANQERLWIQRSLLQVIADVNATAKDWSGAKIKQINTLEVGNDLALDQVSKAKGQELEEAAAITDPKAPPPPETDTASSGSASATSPMLGLMGGGSNKKTDTVSYIKNPSTQFKIMPVLISVLVEQDHMQDFLCALENSPMAIQALDFEMSKPAQAVEKPEQGASRANFAGFAMMGGMGRGGNAAFGGLAAMEQMRKMMTSMATSIPAGGSRMGAEGSMIGGAAAEEKSGKNVRDVDRKKERDKAEAKASKTAKHSSFDPYFNIVEMKVYGQVRFYNPPPKQPPAEPTVATTAETPKPEGDAPKAETPKPEGDTPKAETPKPEGDAPKAETPKPEGDAPKAETPKPVGNPPKAEPATPAK